MKTLSTLILLTLCINCNAQQTQKTQYKSGSVVITVTPTQKTGKYGNYTEKTFKVENLIKENEQWKNTNQYTTTDLLQLKAALDKAIAEQLVETKNEE